MRALFEPAVRLLGRLTYVRKFVLIGLVLLLPTAYVTQAFVAEKQAQVTFSADERDGVAYVVPVYDVLGQALAARRSAAGGGEPPSALASAVARLDEVDGRLGAKLKTSDLWHDARGRMQRLAAGGGAPGQAWADWNEVTGKLLAVIVLAADTSNLTLDPDLDTYYLMDTLITKLPSLADTVGRAADLSIVVAGGGRVPGVEDPRIELAVLRSAITGAKDAVQGNLKRAVETTKDAGLDAQLKEQLAEVGRNADAVVAELDDAVTAGPRRAPVAAGVGASASQSAVALGGRVAPSLDELVAVRIGGFKGKERAVAIAVTLGLLIALYLFTGFYLSVARSVRGILRALSAAAGGDLTVPVEGHTSDEFGRMADALRETLERIRSAIGPIVLSSQGIADQSEQLNAVARGLGGSATDAAAGADRASQVAEGVSADVRTVAIGTEEMGEAIREIARSTSEAAQVAAKAVDITDRTSEVVTRLEISSAEITGVLKLITSIAEQTNLLALNATIEAARAGEAGKGFAVVAGEVKELALQTAGATDDIRMRIEAMRAVSGQLTEAMTELSEIISRIEQTQTAIAGAVEEQTATTGEIGRSVGDAANGSAMIAETVGGVAVAARTASESVDQTQAAAVELARVAEELRDLVGTFRY